MNIFLLVKKCVMNALINVDVLGDIVSFLDITEDKHVLTVFKQLCKISDKEKDQILRTWENNSKYEYTEDEDEDGTMWYVNGKLHREADLPAVEWANGNKEWWMNDKLHRENDKPAVEWANGNKEWWVNDKLHREADKPAVEYADGRKEWWVNDRLIRSSY